jgi:RsiW-degrading membrane proteinase PrsW (M82 family)
VEELTKPLGAILLARRLRGPAEAFLVGMAGGVGFAIVENMLYESAGSTLWAGIATLRGIGGVLHPLNAGMVAVGWYGVRNGLPGAWRRLVGLYGLAVGAHAAWNGGLTILLSGLGVYFFGADTWRLDVFGIGQPGVVLVFMVLEVCLRGARTSRSHWGADLARQAA